MPPPTKLPRLDVPAKGWAWRTWHRLKPLSERRLAFSRAMNNTNVDDDERLARMRTLIDIGLWGDHRALHHRNEFNHDRRSFGYDILIAAKGGMCLPEVVHLAMEAGVDPDWRENNNYDDTLLTMFARRCQEESLKVVLEAGGNPSLRDSCGKTPLHILLERLAGNQDVDVKNNVMPIAEHLLSVGVDINDQGDSRNKEKSSPPIRAAIEKWDQALVQWSIDQGASLDVVDDYQETPFHWAATVNKGWNEWDCAPFMDFLLANGAKIDEPNPRGETPLWQALKWRNEDVAEWLVDHGANINVVPHTFQDPQGYEKPGKKGAPLLQILTEEVHFCEENISLAQKLVNGNPKAWEVITTSGKPLSKVLEKTKSPWLVLVQATQLENTTKPIDQVATPNRKLRL